MVKTDIIERIEKVKEEIWLIQTADKLSRDDRTALSRLQGDLTTLAQALRKAEFVEKLKEFYIQSVGNNKGIRDMQYICNDDLKIVDEKVKVVFDEGYKVFYVNYDSIEAIFKDFGRFLSDFDEYEWRKEA